jgi:hypothetical protein
LDIRGLLRNQLGLSLTFILQPVSLRMEKDYSSEEEPIRQLNAGGSRQCGEVESHIQIYLTGIYPRYRDDIQRVCEARDIQWADAKHLKAKGTVPIWFE